MIIWKKVTSPSDLLMMSDFNAPTNAISNPVTILLMDTIESFGLRNHIHFPTHTLQNTLDLIITEEDLTIVIDTTQRSLFSDHNVVHFGIQTSSKIPQSKSISYRKIKAVNMDLLKKTSYLKFYITVIAIYQTNMWNNITVLSEK